MIRAQLYIYLYFCPIRNKRPIERGTTLPIISIGLIVLSDDIDNATMVPPTQATPMVIKIMAPIKLCFQDIIKIISKTSDGRLCIKNPINISPKLEFESKTSSEKTARKSANKIINILGVQNTNLLIFFSMAAVIFFNYKFGCAFRYQA